MLKSKLQYSSTSSCTFLLENLAFVCLQCFPKSDDDKNMSGESRKGDEKSSNFLFCSNLSFLFSTLLKVSTLIGRTGRELFSALFEKSSRNVNNLSQCSILETIRPTLLSFWCAPFPSNGLDKLEPGIIWAFVNELKMDLKTVQKRVFNDFHHG